MRPWISGALNSSMIHSARTSGQPWASAAAAVVFLLILLMLTVACTDESARSESPTSAGTSVDATSPDAPESEAAGARTSTDSTSPDPTRSEAPADSPRGATGDGGAAAAGRHTEPDDTAGGPLTPWSPRGRVLGLAEANAAGGIQVSGEVLSVETLDPSGTDSSRVLAVTLANDDDPDAPWIIAIDFAMEDIETPHVGYNAQLYLEATTDKTSLGPSGNGGPSGNQEPTDDHADDNDNDTTVAAETTSNGNNAGAEHDNGRSGGETQTLNLVLTPGNRRIFLTEGIVGFRPNRLRLAMDPGIELERLTLSDRAYIGEETIMPAIPADLGSMNFFNTDLWRRDDFELFVWNAVSNVLMLDFADYDVQKRMFGRLGFFVAVAGEVGQVYEYSYYENMHAYNAQAYKTEDLALFFNTVVEKDLAFTEEEEFLRRLLLDYGILTVQEDELATDGEAPRLATGDGAIISIAQATFRPLRQQLLRHEAAHGLFYVDESYRQSMFDIWENLDPDIEQFWELFLGNKGRLDSRQNYDGYNTANLVTMVDEMHAHTIQLPINAVGWYFHDYYLGVMRRVLPESNAFLDVIEEDHQESFGALRDKIARAFEDATDIPGGLMLAVYPERYGQYRQ